jgi:hypothetical protein
MLYLYVWPFCGILKRYSYIYVESGTVGFKIDDVRQEGEIIMEIKFGRSYFVLLCTCLGAARGETLPLHCPPPASHDCKS